MITYDELTAVLSGSGISKDVIQVFDEEYVLPTDGWITTKLGPALDKFFFDTGIKYGEDQYDCNKFAKTASTIADWCWNKTKTENAALAFGMFAYLESGGHMINIAVHRDQNSKLYLAFYEPQPSAPEDGTVIFKPICLTKRTLSTEDIQSCIACLFL